MKLFCSTCKKDTTENITVYENVDGFMVHCGDCNEPVVMFKFEDLGILGALQEKVEDSVPAFTESEETSCDCKPCSDEIPAEVPEYTKLVFTNEDLELIYKALYSRTLTKQKSYGKLVELLEKVTTLMEYRQCQY